MRLLKGAAIGIFFLAITLCLTYPIVARIGTGVLGWGGDNAFYVRQFWWVKHAWFDLKNSLFFDPGAYYPVGYETARGELTPANTVLFLPTTLLWGPVVSYNLALLFSFVASAIGTYLWVRQLTQSHLAGLIAGMIFAFLPYRYAHMVGHLELMSTQWIPLTLFFFERFLKAKKVKDALGIGVCLALVILSSWYYAYAAMILMPVYGLIRTYPWGNHWLQRRWWVGGLLAALVTLGMVLPFALPYYHLSMQHKMARDLGALDMWSLNPYDFFIPNLSHPLWRDQIGTIFTHQAHYYVEMTVMFGGVASLLGSCGLFCARHKSWLFALIGVGGLAYLLALGPTLHWHDQRVQLFSMPFIPLPAYGLFKWAPFASSMRVMARFGLWSGLMVAALAGWGGKWLLTTVVRRKTLWFFLSPAVMLFCIGFETYGMSPQWLSLQPRAVDIWLAQQPESDVIAELPLTSAQSPLQDYYVTQHQHNTILGPVGDSFPPDILQERLGVLQQFPSPVSLKALRSWSVDYVLLNAQEIENWAEFSAILAEIEELELQGVFEDIWVYRLK